MIGLRDATMLALTKLRTRKVRLAVTIIVSGLLFSALATASFVVRGGINGVTDFNKEGLGSRFIILAQAQMNYYANENQEIIDRAKAIHNDTVARKKAAAKQLGISYEADNEPSPVSEMQSSIGGQKQQYLNSEHPAAVQAIKEYQAAHPAAGEAELKEAAAAYNPKAFFSGRHASYNLGGASFQVLKDGQESYNSAEKDRGGSDATDGFVNSWGSLSGELLEPFMLPGQNTKQGSDGSIPIIVPNNAAEQMLKLEALPPSANSHDRLDRTKEIRTKAPDVRFQACYRNSTSAGLLSQAISQKADIDAHKNDKNYRQPDLVYGLPTEPCGAVPVTRDVRSSAEKTYAAKQEQFERMFGKAEPVQQTLSFRIVGITPDMDFGGAISIGQLFRSIIASSLGGGWYMPDDFTTSNPLIAAMFSNDADAFTNFTQRFVEFNTAQSAKAFLEKENCEIDYGKISANGRFNPQEICEEQGHPFTLGSYGSNSIALESFGKGFTKVFRIAALAISAIAAIIMMGTVGRMIADSRRETAVFRAIGAKRMDIAQIYITYAILLSLLVATFALIVGFALSSIANMRFSPELTVEAINAFNANDLNKTFTLYAFYWSDILMLIGLSLVVGLLSAVFPLLRNLRRNPIRDMRDDT